MPFNIGPLQLVLIIVILLMVFGARRLPEIGRSLGSSAREFKQGITANEDDVRADAGGHSGDAAGIEAPSASNAVGGAGEREHHDDRGAR